jgi:hypothetical protein
MLAFVSMLACAPHGSLGRDLPEGTTGGTTPPQTTSAADDGTSTHASASASGSEGESESGSGSGSGSTTDADSSTTAADLCAPAGDDTPCNACRKLECCDVWTACHADEICVCIESCIAEGGDPLNCETVHCAGPNDAWTHVHDCDATNCAAEC